MAPPFRIGTIEEPKKQEATAKFSITAKGGAAAAPAPVVEKSAAKAPAAGDGGGGGAPTSGPPLQAYVERLVRLIPSEVVGLYLVGIGVVPHTNKLAQAIWAFVCLGLVVLVRAIGSADPGRKVGPEWGSVAVSSVSFVIWVYTMPGAFASYNLAVPWVGSLLILAWTFSVPYFYKGSTAFAG